MKRSACIPIFSPLFFLSLSLARKRKKKNKHSKMWQNCESHHVKLCTTPNFCMRAYKPNRMYILIYVWHCVEEDWTTNECWQSHRHQCDAFVMEKAHMTEAKHYTIRYIHHVLVQCTTHTTFWHIRNLMRGPFVTHNH